MDHLDQKVFETLKDIMEEEFNALIEVFLTDTRRHLVLIQDALTHQDVEVLRASAHAIKGSASNIGTVALSHAASELERNVKFQLAEFSELKKMFNAIDVEFTVVAPMLREAITAS